MRRLLVSAAVAFALAAPLAAPLSAMAQMPSPEAIFKAWDKNKDGGIDKDEWAAAGRKPERFAMVDANGDGKVSLDELKDGIAKMKAARGK